MRKILIYLMLTISINVFAVTHTVSNAKDFENKLMYANSGDTIKIVADISLIKDYKNRENGVSNKYGFLDIGNKITIEGENISGRKAQLILVGRNLDLKGDLTLRNINLVMGLPNTTDAYDKPDANDLSNSAIIYANGYNVTLENVDTKPQSGLNLNIRPTVVMGAREGVITDLKNKLEIKNNDGTITELKTIVAGSEGKTKQSETIIKLDENTKLTSTGSTILLKNINVKKIYADNKLDNVNVKLENKSKDVRTFVAREESNVEILIDNVKYDNYSDIKKSNFNGEIDNLVIKGDSRVIVETNAKFGNVKIEKDKEKSPELVIGKIKNSLDDDDEYSLPTESVNVVIKKIVSNTEDAKIVLNSGKVNTEKQEGKITIRGNGYTANETTDTIEESPEPSKPNPSDINDNTVDNSSENSGKDEDSGANSDSGESTDTIIDSGENSTGTEDTKENQANEDKPTDEDVKTSNDSSTIDDGTNTNIDRTEDSSEDHTDIPNKNEDDNVEKIKKEIFDKYERYLDLFDYTYTDIGDSISNGIYSNITLAKSIKANEFAGGIFVGGAGKISKVELGGFIGIDYDIAQQYYGGLSLKYNIISSYIRYRLSNYDSKKSHNVDIYLRYSQKFNITSNFSIEPKVAGQVSYVGKVDLGNGAVIRQRAMLFGELGLKLAYSLKIFDIYLMPEIRLGYNKKVLEYSGQEISKNSNFVQYGTTLGLEKKISEFKLGAKLKFEGNEQKDFSIRGQLLFGYEF